MRREHNRLMTTVVGALVVGVVGHAARAADITSTWTAANGDWDNPANWDSNPQFPNNGGQTFDAVIDAGGPDYTVTLDTTVAIEDLTLNSASATVAHTAGTFTATGAADLLGGTYRVDGGTIANTVVNQNGGGLVFTSNPANLLDGATVQNGLDLMTGTEPLARLINGAGYTGDATLGTGAKLIIDDTRTLDNTSIHLEGNDSDFGVSGDNTLTLGPNALVNLRGANAQITADLFLGGNGQVVNRGTIAADADGNIRNMTIDPDVFTNASGGVVSAVENARVQIGRTGRSWVNEAGGTIQATGGLLRFNGDWDNDGTVLLTDSTMELNNDFLTADIGVITRSGSTGIFIQGNLDNTGDTLALTAATGTYTVRTGKITGGEVSQEGGAVLAFAFANTNRLDGVIVLGDLHLDTGNGARVRLLNGSGFTGDANLGNSARLIIEDTQILDTTTINLDGTTAELDVSGNNTLTLGPGATVNLRGPDAGIHSDPGVGQVINQGTISADAEGDALTMTIDPHGFSQDGGTIESKNNATLSIPGGYTQTGGVTRLSGGTIETAMALIDILGGSLEGSGVVTAPVSIADTLSVGESAGLLTVNGDVTLLGTAQSEFEIGGTAAGTEHDHLDVNADLAIGGELIIALIDGFEALVDASDTFVIATADTEIAGAFTNVLSGNRLDTAGHHGTFRVSYGAGSPFNSNSIVLSDFLIPEPATGCVLIALAPAFVRRRRATD